MVGVSKGLKLIWSLAGAPEAAAPGPATVRYVGVYRVQ
jgi:hypothetical protein